MRPIKINPHPNPTGLSFVERELCVDLLRSLERSVVDRIKERRGLPWYEELPAHLYEEVRLRVGRAAMNQMTGRQKSPGQVFILEREVPVDDMAYVRRSLGVETTEGS